VKTLVAKNNRLDERTLISIAEKHVQKAAKANRMNTVKQIEDLEDKIYQAALG
jgi:hypothetical protein